MKLSTHYFEKAEHFIQTQARPLDIQLHQYHFKQGSAKAVLDELAAYQNADGGFGHGIESDFRLAASSPMATSVGLQYCLKVNATADQPIVRDAINYLMNTFDLDHHYWPSTFADVNEAPHAPWWHVSEIAPPDEERWPNVSAELAGYIHHYREIVPDPFYDLVTNRALNNLHSTDTLSSFYDILCWQRTAVLMPEPIQTEIINKIQRTFSKMEPITHDSLKELPVFVLAEQPTAIFAQQYPETLNDMLTQEISRQAADGGWWPAWEWGQYEEIWPTAQKEWAGKITAEALFAFKNFGFLEKAAE